MIGSDDSDDSDNSDNSDNSDQYSSVGGEYGDTVVLMRKDYEELLDGKQRYKARAKNSEESVKCMMRVLERKQESLDALQQEFDALQQEFDALQKQRSPEAQNGARTAVSEDDTAENKELRAEVETLKQTVETLQRQLQSAGQTPVECDTLHSLRKKMHEAVQQMILANDGSAEKDVAEKNIEKWDQAIRLHPEYVKEQEEERRQWDEEQGPANTDAVHQMRKLIHPNLAKMSVQEMVGFGLTRECSVRLLAKRALRFIVTHPDTLKTMHIADLNLCTNQGLDIVEMRAIYACLPLVFDLDGDGKKAEWRDNFVQKLKELVRKEVSNVLGSGLRAAEKRHRAYEEAELELKRRTEENAKKGRTTTLPQREPYYFDPTLPVEFVAVAKSTAFQATKQRDFPPKKGQERKVTAPSRRRTVQWQDHQIPRNHRIQ